MTHCTYCKKELDKQARGLVCSLCWAVFVRQFKVKAGEVRTLEVRSMERESEKQV